MDHDDARDQLDSVLRAHRDSARPALPIAVGVASALAFGLGVALLGQPSTSTGMFAGLRALAVVSIALAYLLPTKVRQRRGVVGYEGQVRRTNVVWSLALVVLFVCGLSADSVLGFVYVILGAVAAITYFFALRGWGLPT